MSFNFGGFLSGMSQSIVQSIEDEKEQQRKFEYLSETEAMRTRAARKAERDTRNRVLDDLAGSMEALGFDPDNIEKAMKSGKGAMELYIEAAKNNYGKTDFFNPNVMFDVATATDTQEDIIENMNATGDMGAKNADVTDITTTTLTGPSTTKDQKVAYLEAAFGTPDKEYGSLDSFHAAIVQKQMNTTDPKKLAQLEAQEKTVLQKIADKQNDDTEDGETPDNWMTAENVLLNSDRAFKNNLAQFQIKYDDLTETLTGATSGKAGLVSIARLRGANSLNVLNNVVPVKDTKLTAHIGNEIQTAKIDLTTYARRVVDLYKQNSNNPESLTGGSKFEFNRYKGIANTVEDLNKINFSLSDVVQFGSEILIYVGENVPIEGVKPEFPFYRVGM